MPQRFSINQNSSLRDRSALFGHSPEAYSSYSSSRSPSPYLANANRTADELESQNDEDIEGLSAKVKALKSITIGIGNEIRDSAVQLSQMNDAFEETTGILAGTFRRMNNMAERQGCRWLWYIVFLILVFWFFIVVWWFRR
ncbi:BET1 [Sanghuangporus weigelae]